MTPRTYTHATRSLFAVLLWTGPVAGVVSVGGTDPPPPSVTVQLAVAAVPEAPTPELEPAPVVAPVAEPALPAPSPATEPITAPVEVVAPAPVATSAPWVPALTGAEQGVPIKTNGVVVPGQWMCWNEYGYPLNQAWETCPPNWGNRPPENPTPVGESSRL